jgi:hypothetical protein
MYNYTNKFWKGEKIVYRFSVKNTFDSVTFCHLEIGLNDNIEVDEEIVLNNILTAYDVLDKKMKG